jgi:hypothetical protein
MEKVRTHFQLVDGPAICLENLRVPPGVKAVETLDWGALKCAVIKESSIPDDRTTEEQVFMNAPGLFGTPNIICSYEVEGRGSIYCAYYSMESKYQSHCAVCARCAYVYAYTLRL